MSLPSAITFSRRSLLVSAAVLAIGSSGARASEPKLPVVASFSILGDMVREIGGDRIALTVLVKAGVDAHGFAPTPADARAVGEAGLVFVNGLGFDGWMRRLRQSSASKARFVEVAAGIKPIKDASGHSHGHGHSHGDYDPHAWQSVPNAIIYATAIRDGLIAADPAGRATYEANAARYIGELQVLDAEIRTAVARLPADRRRIVTSHDAFGYFQATYGLTFSAPRGVSTASEASARDIARIIQQIRRDKIAAVFVETISDPRQIEQIARESGARVGGTLFSDALSPPDGPAPTFIRMMRHNIRTISEALAPGS
jgi:zinc/manganese transport system substrate-binding protein